tara:strand:+ start:724 stop:1398 length:675 start_codon:yes stop_codon:yes gene_type:complete
MKQNTCFIILAPKTDQYWAQFNNKLSIKLKNDYLINYQIQNIFKAYPRSNIIVIGDFTDMDLAKRKKVKYINVCFDEFMNIGGMLTEVISDIKNQSICIFNVGLIFNISGIKDLKISKTAMISSHNKKFQSKIGCIVKNQNQIESIFYDLNNRLFEFLYIHSKDLEQFKQICNACVKKYMYLFEISNILIKHNMDINIYFTNINSVHLDHPDSLLKAKRLMNTI